MTGIDTDEAKELIKEALRPSPNETRFGRFRVDQLSVYTHGHAYLASALDGCAVFRCELLHHARAFEYYAWHPEFDPVPEGDVVPDYGIVMRDNGDGTHTRIGFTKGEI